VNAMDDCEALEAELRDLLARLRPGGSQAHCQQLRSEIESVQRQLAAQAYRRTDERETI
jgi:hypothetical protein